MNEPLLDAWAIVEIMGHQALAGRVSEVSVGGGPMVRIDVPETKGQSAFTRFYGGSAIFSITPVSEEVAKYAAERMMARPVTIYMPDILALPERGSGWQPEEPDDGS